MKVSNALVGGSHAAGAAPACLAPGSAAARAVPAASEAPKPCLGRDCEAWARRESGGRWGVAIGLPTERCPSAAPLQGPPSTPSQPHPCPRAWLGPGGCKPCWLQGCRLTRDVDGGELRGQRRLGDQRLGQSVTVLSIVAGEQVEPTVLTRMSTAAGRGWWAAKPAEVLPRVATTGWPSGCALCSPAPCPRSPARRLTRQCWQRTRTRRTRSRCTRCPAAPTAPAGWGCTCWSGHRRRWCSRRQSPRAPWARRPPTAARPGRAGAPPRPASAPTCRLRMRGGEGRPAGIAAAAPSLLHTGVPMAGGKHAAGRAGCRPQPRTREEVGDGALGRRPVAARGHALRQRVLQEAAARGRRRAGRPPAGRLADAHGQGEAGGAVGADAVGGGGAGGGCGPQRRLNAGIL